MFAKLKAKFWLLFVEKPDIKIDSFQSMKINFVKDYILFNILKNYLSLKRWAKGNEWCSNPKYPKMFLKKIKAYKLVLEDVKFIEESNLIIEKQNNNKRIEREYSGVSWNDFRNKIQSIVYDSKLDEEKLEEIDRYIQYLDEIGGIGKLLSINTYFRLGGICYSCKSAIGNCAIIDKNKIECKYYEKR